MQLPPRLYRNKLDSEGRRLCWDGAAVRDLIGAAASIRTIERSLSVFLPETLITATPDIPGPDDKAYIVIFN